MATPLYTFGTHEVQRIARSVRTVERIGERLGLDAAREVPIGRLHWLRGRIGGDVVELPAGAVVQVAQLDGQSGEPFPGETKTFTCGVLSDEVDYPGLLAVLGDASDSDGRCRITFDGPVWVWGADDDTLTSGTRLGPTSDLSGQCQSGYPGFVVLGPSRTLENENRLWLCLADAPARVLATVRQPNGGSDHTSTVELLVGDEDQTAIFFEAEKQWGSYAAADTVLCERIGKTWYITAPLPGEDRMYEAQADWAAAKDGSVLVSARELVWQNNVLVVSGPVFQVRQFQQFAGKAGFRGWCRRRSGQWFDVTTGCKV